jgi:hypothetical protein
MNTWMYRIAMTLVAINLVMAVIMVVTAKPLPEMCLDGIIMQQHELMWTQKGLWPTHCMPIDKD